MQDGFYYIKSNWTTGNRIDDVVLGNLDTDLIKVINGKVYIFVTYKDCFLPFIKWNEKLFNITRVVDSKILKDIELIRVKEF